IAGSLGVCAAQTYRMWQQGVAYLPPEVARVAPMALALGAALATLATLRSLRTLRTIQRTPLESGQARVDGT
ncbi:MAG TPA: hypothetical protein VF247_12070, partial [Candidatus Krumholzibacteria bacterium]